MNKPMEHWAKEKIAHLRSEAAHLNAEADILEKSLRQYREDEAATAPESNIAQSSRGRPPGSKSQAICDFIREAGDRGVALPEIYRFVETQHIQMPRNTIRSTVYSQQHRGLIHRRTDRYFFVKAGLNGNPPSPAFASVSSANP